MDLLRESDFRKEIKASPRAGYLFFGDEDYLKAFAVRSARDAICPDPSFAFFNDIRLDALDFSPEKLIDALMPLPMMADRKLVVLTGMNFNAIKPYELDVFCDALSHLTEFDYNTLIVTITSDCLDGGYLPKTPSKLLQRLSEHLTPVWFERCTTAKLTAWIGKHFAHNGVEAAPDFCSLMADYCGHGMFELANEIDKLSYYTRYHNQTKATADNMRLVCTPAMEYDAFAFTNAIMEGRREAALGILADYRRRRYDPLIILGEVTQTICNMTAVYSMTAAGMPTDAIAKELSSIRALNSPFKVGLYQKSLRGTNEARLRRALEACTTADTALKLSPQGYTALERLICSL